MSQSGLLKLNEKGLKRLGWMRTIDTSEIPMRYLYNFLFQKEVNTDIDDKDNLEYQYQCNKYSDVGKILESKE